MARFARHLAAGSRSALSLAVLCKIVSHPARFFLWVVVFSVGVFLWLHLRKSAPPPPSPAPPARVAVPPPAPPPAPVAAPARPKPLTEPPEIVKAVYFTNWSAGLKRRVDYLVELRRKTGMNAVVIDIKDYSGFLAYRADLPDAVRYHAIRPAIRDVDAVIARLHAEGILVVARITCFQDPILAQARPDLAVHRKSKLEEAGKPSEATLWRDRKGLAWVDPSSREAWAYLVAIAKDTLARGFDEVNFDYVRFPSDGDMKDMAYTSWDGKTPKHAVIAAFLAYLRSELGGKARLSADLFGLATVNSDDLGIGQVIEDAYAGFDYVCPMVYPSHFARKFLGFANPAEHPYDVIHYSMQKAVERLAALYTAPPVVPVSTAAAAEAPSRRPLHDVKLRPWLQDFSLGARYDAAMVKAQIEGVQDALGDRYAGYMLWSSSNVYTQEAIE
jgi:hypothetical protein